MPGLLGRIDAGLIAPSENAQALADAVGRVLDDAELRASVGRRARRLVEAEYSLDASMAELERVITDVAARGCGARMR
jgi:glycosyltransferase involved in cell wall biosynthesis